MSGMWYLALYQYTVRKMRGGDNILKDNLGDYLSWENAFKEKETEINSSTNCIICGEESRGYLFCKKCYNKYKNKTITIRITNCKDIEILSAEYASPYVCEDGHSVKSKSEMTIDNYLYHKGIAHAYEKPFPIDKDKSHDLHPDFYLLEKDVYIEHLGMEYDKAYQQSKAYKLDIYKKAKLTVICTHEADMQNISRELDRKLSYYEKGKVNYENENE